MPPLFSVTSFPSFFSSFFFSSSSLSQLGTSRGTSGLGGASLLSLASTLPRKGLSLLLASHRSTAAARFPLPLPPRGFLPAEPGWSPPPRSLALCTCATDAAPRGLSRSIHSKTSPSGAPPSSASMTSWAIAAGIGGTLSCRRERRLQIWTGTNSERAAKNWPTCFCVCVDEGVCGVVGAKQGERGRERGFFENCVTTFFFSPFSVSLLLRRREILQSPPARAPCLKAENSALSNRKRERKRGVELFKRKKKKESFFSNETFFFSFFCFSHLLLLSAPP